MLQLSIVQLLIRSCICFRDYYVALVAVLTKKQAIKSQNYQLFNPNRLPKAQNQNFLSLFLDSSCSFFFSSSSARLAAFIAAA